MPPQADSPAPEHKPHSIIFYVVLAGALFAFTQTFTVLSPILFSFLLILLTTLAVNPIISRLRSWTGGRKRAAGLVLTGVLALIALTGWVAIDPLKKSVLTISEQLPAYWQRLQKPLIKIEQQAILSEEKLQGEVSAEIARDADVGGAPGASPPKTESAKTVPPSAKATPAKVTPTVSDEDEKGSLRTRLTGALMGVFGQIKSAAVVTTQSLVVLATVFFGAIFMLMDPRPIFGFLFSVVPERHHDKTLVIMQRIAKFVPRWAGAMLISMMTIGSLFFLFMWPIFGFMDALVLGLIACLFSAVPFLGPILSLIPALLLALGEGGMTPMWVILAYMAVQALEGNVVLPIVMSKGMKVHPVAVIFSMLLCIAAFGVLGVLIASPLVAIASIVHDELFRKKYLPSVTDADLDRLARKALLEKASMEQ